MAENEDVVRKNSIMDSDVVVCISDDEDQGDNNVGAAKSKTKITSYNSNVYEHWPPPKDDKIDLPASAQANLEATISMRNTDPNVELQQFRDIQITDPNEGNGFVYVPDDCEEQDQLIAPIDQISHEIIYGRNLQPPTEFPYTLLEKLEKHLTDKCKGNLPVTTKTKIWSCVLHQLSLIRIQYQDRIDVSIY